MGGARLVLRHVVPNVLIPIVTVVGLEFGHLIAFSVVTESVFSWPGMGKLIIDSVLALDRPVVVAYLLVTLLLFVVLNLVVDLQLSLPAVLVALILLAVLGQGVDKTLLALVIVQWAYFARTVRGAAQVERRKEYVEAALGQGLPALRVMFRHILPNCMAPLVVTGTLQIAHAITLEATMSFLGIGLPRTQPSLGMLIANGFEYMLSNKYWISVFPGVALVLLIGSINLVGDRLRRVLNPRLEA
ncbi:ABC transporter permease subunit [Cupriavidus taiwanensis]|uniref:ABC transporter permease subunit n=1 Tax=Cupriavidus taiwanensis TaxID=164546 RepID=UPI00253F98B4|nr:ABC transporter permease subunit [Cupriavidus taiwanensis]MDK3021732.1 ABC transporter permease subunit [Cupriavidus taiwanensis]